MSAPSRAPVAGWSNTGRRGGRTDTVSDTEPWRSPERGERIAAFPARRVGGAQAARKARCWVMAASRVVAECLLGVASPGAMAPVAPSTVLVISIPIVAAEDNPSPSRRVAPTSGLPGQPIALVARRASTRRAAPLPSESLSLPAASFHEQRGDDLSVHAAGKVRCAGPKDSGRIVQATRAPLKPIRAATQRSGGGCPAIGWSIVRLTMRAKWGIAPAGGILPQGNAPRL